MKADAKAIGAIGCPFCGSRPVVRRRSCSSTWVGFCPAAGCPAGIVHVQAEDADAVVRKWNTRADLSAGRVESPSTGRAASGN